MFKNKNTGKRENHFSAESGAYLVSDRELLIYGCKKVCAYNESSITLELLDITLTVNGKGLNAKTYFGDEMKIIGKITELHVKREEKQ